MRLTQDSERVFDGGHESVVYGEAFLCFNGTPGQGISSHIGEGNAPRIHSFAIELRISVPEKTPEFEAWLAAFSAGEALSQDGEAGTLAAGWTTDGDLQVTLYGASLAAWRRLTIPGHVAAYAGKVVTLRIVRDAVAGTLTVEQDGVALEGDETTSGTAPDWDADIQASWLHVCGAKDQPGISAGYVGRVHAVKYTIHSFRSEAVLWLDAAHVDNPGNPQALINRGGQKGTVGDAQFGSSSSADSADPLVLTGSGYVYLPGTSGNHITSAVTTAQRVNDDLDLRVRLYAEVLPPGGTRYIAGRWADSGGQRGWTCVLSSNGTITIQCSFNGSDLSTVNSGTAVSATAGEFFWVRFTRDGSTGDVKFYESSDGSTWSQLGATQSTTPGPLFDTNAGLALGVYNVAATISTTWRGGISYAELRNGIDGPVVARFDASQCGQTGYTDAINSTVWTVNRATSGRKTVVKEDDRPLLLFGGDDFLEIAHNAALNFGTNPFTIALLQRTHGSKASQTRMAKCAAISNASNPGWHIHSFGGVPTTGAAKTIASGDVGLSSNITNSPESGVREMLSFVRDETGYTYHDGERSGSKIATVHNCDNELPVRIARLSGSAMNYGEFELFGAAIFRRYLTNDELVALEREMLWELEQATGTTYGRPVLEWDFSMPKLTLPDLSGNGITGAISQSAYARLGVYWDCVVDRVIDGGYHPEPGVSIYLDPDPWRPPIVLDGGEEDFRPLNWQDFDLEVGRVDRPLSSGEGTESIDEQGRVIRTTPGLDTISDYYITPIWADPTGVSPLTWQSANEAIATVEDADGTGVVTGHTPGIVEITVVSEAGRSRSTTAWIQTATASGEVVEHVGFDEGSVMAEICEDFRARIEGRTPSDATKRIFSSWNHAAGTYTRNPNCWAAGIDSSCISPWNSRSGGFTRGCIPITAQHGLCVKHYALYKGDRVRCVGMDNSVHERTVIETADIPFLTGVNSDLTIVLFDSPFDEAIQPAHLLPEDFRDYIPEVVRTPAGALGKVDDRCVGPLPVLVADGEEKALIHIWKGDRRYNPADITESTSVSYNANPAFQTGWRKSPYLDVFAAWSEKIIGGDSGSPVGLGWQGKFVALTLLSTPGAGPCLHGRLADITALIATVDAKAGISTGLTPQTIDLSTHKSYA